MTHNGLQDIISGKKQVSFGEFIQTILGYLRRSKETGPLVETYKHLKEEEKQKLIGYINTCNLWIDEIDIDLYISEGAEQKVYLKDEKSVWKLNDAIYYASWQDYLTNLLFHNYFFPDTAYELKGFFKTDDTLYAVVVQPFVKATQKTDLSKVKQFMQENGFINNRNNDYYNPELGIILEDLHDENVLTQNDILYFIDTVFYCKV